VRVRSFAFPGGYPADATGHGGGYVFDCRAIDNPGRLEEYGAMTGRDADVIDFLERTPSVETFWAHASAMVDHHVEEFLRRGFDTLTVAFGCTGGQHRSVYMAERMAGHVEARYPGIDVDLDHREREAWPNPSGTVG
jgi:RNase adaptor protein for sRNA GlmZ degradation